MDNYWFIYVFSRVDKEKLEASGFQLFQQDDIRHVYVFLNNTDLKFDDSVKYQHRSARNTCGTDNKVWRHQW